MSQIEATKLNMLVRTGYAGLAVPKLNLYARLLPGDGDSSSGQVHIYAQKIRRA